MANYINVRVVLGNDQTINLSLEIIAKRSVFTNIFADSKYTIPKLTSGAAGDQTNIIRSLNEYRFIRTFSLPAVLYPFANQNIEDILIGKITYRIPMNVWTALNFIVACERFLDLHENCIILNEASLYDILIHHDLSQEALSNHVQSFIRIGYDKRVAKLRELGGETRFFVLKLLCSDITNLTKDLDTYNSVHEALTSINKTDASDAPAHFGDVVERECYSLLLNKLVPKEMRDTFNITTDKINCKSIIECMNLLAPQFTAENKLYELDNILVQLTIEAKRQFYSQCIGQRAHDGLLYTFYYTEWIFYRYADYCVEKDGRLSISVQDNLGYLTYYAPDKPFHAIFADEMEHLANLLGLEFDKDCDFHKKMIFTLHSSKKLIQQGLHLSPTYLKSLLVPFKHKLSFFWRAHHHALNHEDVCFQDENQFQRLPLELITQIVDNDGTFLNQDVATLTASLQATPGMNIK